MTGPTLKTLEAAIEYLAGQISRLIDRVDALEEKQKDKKK